MTKTDKLLLNGQAYKISHGIKNIASEIEECVSVLEDINYLQRNLDDIARNIAKVFLCVITTVIEVMNETGENIPPIG